MNKVFLLRNFVEDRRISMEIYADNLLEGLKNQDSEFHINEFRPQLRPAQSNFISLSAIWRMRFARYIDYPRQIRNLRPDLFHVVEHGYAHLVGKIPPEKTIVTVHDLIPLLRYKGCIPGVKSESCPWFSRYSLKFLKKAAHIVAISENTKQDLIQHCECDPDKISVVYYGLQNLEHVRLSTNRARIKLGLPDVGQRLILVTGQEFYKNLGTSVKVFQRIREQRSDVSLVHLGRDNAIWRKAKSECANPDEIIEFSNLSYEEMVSLYVSVDCVLFPSWYEGFGLPPLEAMACGTPAVTSNVASLPEAVGPAGLTAFPDDVEGLKIHVETILNDVDQRKYLIDQGLRYAARFTWENCSKNILEIYRKILDG